MQYQEVVNEQGERFLLPLIAFGAAITLPFWLSRRPNVVCVYPYPAPVPPMYPMPYPYPVPSPYLQPYPLPQAYPVPYPTPTPIPQEAIPIAPRP